MFQNVTQWFDVYGQTIHNGAVFGALIAMFLVFREIAGWMGKAEKKIDWLREEMEELDLHSAIMVESLHSRVSMLEQASKDRADRDRKAAADRQKPKVIAIKKSA
jgi:hypothetical protein